MAKKSLEDFAKEAAQDAKDNAAKNGFARLTNQAQLVENKSTSSDALELEADLAARQIEHCLVAWNYLSQALIALLNGQDDIAVHLAYYSELRAANSLLASTGVANKELKSYYLNQNNQRRACEVPTHNFIREIWKNWCNRADSQEAFSTLKVYPAITIADVSQAMGLSANHNNPLLKWGYELVEFSKDHRSRNVASYQIKSAYTAIEPLDEKDYCKFVFTLWEHLISTGSPGNLFFERLYAQYIIHGVCLDFANSASETDDNKEAVFLSQQQKILNKLHENSGESLQTLQSILATSFDPDPKFELFELASSTDTHPKNIISRAFVLSRFSANKLNINLSETQCTNGTMWIQSWLQEAGVISTDSSPTDLFNDADLFIEDAEKVSKSDLRNVWIDYPKEALQSCRLDKGLCWEFEFVE